MGVGDLKGSQYLAIHAVSQEFVNKGRDIPQLSTTGVYKGPDNKYLRLYGL